ncbi:unnamed protein product [Camellia sinensis]
MQIVSSKEEVDASDSFCIQPVDLKHFFEDGKIYGYQGLKITIWVNNISFHAYAEITLQSTSDGGKGITDLKSALQSIILKREILQHNTTNGHNSDSNSYLKTDCSNLKDQVDCTEGMSSKFMKTCKAIPLLFGVHESAKKVKALEEVGMH